MSDAVEAYREAVVSGEFPADEHSHVESELEDLY
jgi:3-methyl-2-oxobutanoate hydroxymethyltransferase